jgi:ketosteroid isomerase-like protein
MRRAGDVDDATATRAAVDRLNEAVNRHDIDALMNTFSDDCVFENTGPGPDGERFEGQEAVRAFWTRWFERNPDARFEAEEIITAADRCIVRWVYRKIRDGAPWHLRGVDVFRVRGGRVAEKLAYTKG